MYRPDCNHIFQSYKANQPVIGLEKKSFRDLYLWFNKIFLTGENSSIKKLAEIGYCTVHSISKVIKISTQRVCWSLMIETKR